MTRVGLALAAGLALMAVAIGLTLTRSPPAVAWSDFTPLNGSFLKTDRSVQACQAHETLPRGASAVRISLYDAYGPRVTVKVLSGERVLTSGVRDAGWIGESPTVPLAPVHQGSSQVKLCFALGRPAGLVALDGSPASAAGQATSADGRGLGGRMRIEYLKPGSRSWWSLASSVARHMGLGHWPAGTWVVLLVVALIAAVVAGVSWLTVRDLR